MLASAGLYAYNIIVMRQQALVARPLEIAFYQYVVVVAVLALAAPFVASVPAGSHWPALVLAAVLALISLMLLAWASALRVSVLAPAVGSAAVLGDLASYVAGSRALTEVGEAFTRAALAGILRD